MSKDGTAVDLCVVIDWTPVLVLTVWVAHAEGDAWGPEWDRAAAYVERVWRSAVRSG